MPRRSDWRLCAGLQAVCNRLPPTFDPREEPGALAAHAGICAGGEEQSSSLPRPSGLACVMSTMMVYRAPILACGLVRSWVPIAGFFARFVAVHEAAYGLMYG